MARLEYNDLTEKRLRILLTLSLEPPYTEEFWAMWAFLSFENNRETPGLRCPFCNTHRNPMFWHVVETHCQTALDFMAALHELYKKRQAQRELRFEPCLN